MSLHSFPRVGSKNVAEWIGKPRSVCEYPRRGERVKYPSKIRNLAEDLSEEVLRLSKSKSGLVGAMSRIHRELNSLMDEKGSITETMSKYMTFDNAWKGFVDVHEKLTELLDDDEEREKATRVYEEQRFRKLDLDSRFETFKRECCEFSCPEPSVSSSSSHSSRRSSASRKKEKLAIAQLKLSKLKKQQELSLKMTQLRLQKELMDAELEAEQAMVSLEIFNEDFKEEESKVLHEELWSPSHVVSEVEVKEPGVHHPTLSVCKSESHVVPGGAVREPRAERVVSEVEVKEPGVHHPTLSRPVFKSESHVVPGGAVSEPRAERVVSEVEVKEPGVHHPTLSRPVCKSESHVIPGAAVREPRAERVVSEVEVKEPGVHHPTFSRPTVESKLPEVVHPVCKSESHVVPGGAVREPRAERVVTEFHPSMSTRPGGVPPQVKMGGSDESIPSSSVVVEIVKALRQVVCTPKIEYMHFDGDPLKYISFMHNFETCLEKDNPEESRRLQLLIQHCTGKAREAIESCVNLPPNIGYETAKETLHENFGKAHIIAKAHITKLIKLPEIKSADGSSLLEFTRNLEVASRTLSGMGPEYMSELDHSSTLKELNRKLPIFLRGKWAETAGRIIESGWRPRFGNFLEFIKRRAKLMNNEFAEDLKYNPSRDKDKYKEKVKQWGSRVTTLVGVESSSSAEGESVSDKSKGNGCEVCSGKHRIWKCEKFRELFLKERKKIVYENGLCIRCLSGGHYARECDKKHFKCRYDGCGKEHHSLLHPPNSKATNETPKGEKENKGEFSSVSVSKSSTSVSAATGAGEARVCLGVVPVRVQAKGNDVTVLTHALLDTGSEVTLCQESLIKKLGMTGRKVNFTLTGMTGSADVQSQVVDIVVKSMDGETSIEMSDVRAVKKLPISESCIPKKKDLEHWEHLRGVDLHELQEDVGLLIGVKQKPAIFLPLEYKVGKESEPVGVRYSLGWTVMGPMGDRKKEMGSSVNFVRFSESDRSDKVVMFDGDKNLSGVRPLKTDNVEEQHLNKDLEWQLERLWKTDFEDSMIDTKVTTSVEDERALKVMQESLTKVDGHYQVALPWRSEQPSLPNNRPMAERRNQLLKKRLLRDEDLCEKYRATMNEYIEKGHAERVPKEELSQGERPVWYLPHHPVTHPLKPGKVRVVFDCAAEYDGTSLNKELLQGPDLTNSLVGVLIRFREEPVAIVADVEGMFHQVLVPKHDCDAFRFLWWPNGNLSEGIQEYRMVKHIFGATSSPSVANYCLKKTADLNQDGIDEETVKTVHRNMYVDDLIKSVGSIQKAIKLASQLRGLLSRGGFRLHKWCSNEKEVLSSIPESERAGSVVNLDLEDLPPESTLGLKWNIQEDMFVWSVYEKVLDKANQKPMSKRTILSVIHSLFDPLGFLAPYTMKAKLLLQMLNRKKIGWDEVIGEEERVQWIRWLEDLSKLESVQVERCFKPKGFGEVVNVQLHLFSDASRQGYSAVAYLRLVDTEGSIHCVFVMGKARLAPVREISIPRLELSGAVVSVKLSKVVEEELEMKVDDVTFWTDSMSVLKCIKNETKRFHTFESNRLTVIHSGSRPTQWRYVNRDVNPADDGSKGLKLDCMLKNNRWLRGPEFLWKEEEDWPDAPEIPKLEDSDPAVRKEAQIYSTMAKIDAFDNLIAYYSSWWRLKRAVAWFVRFKEYLRRKVNKEKKSDEKESCLMGDLSVEELRCAESSIFRYVQSQEFCSVLELLREPSDKKSKKKLMRKAGMSIFKLNPQLQTNGLLRVGGRIDNATVSESAKHPVILPYKHHVTDMIIEDCHVNVGHMGQESVLSSLRQRFWIVKARSAVRRVIRKCVSCQMRNRRLGEQFMANLPRVRLIPNQPAFSYTGVDYFGPMEVKLGRAHVKRYGCLFTCLNVRAIHVEIAHKLDTDSMINCLRRFISIRGTPEEIMSDNGSNFTSADKELKEAVREWNQNKISNFCTQKDIKWNFNPPSASHMGGVWERMVRTIKQVLKSVVGQQLLDDEGLSTVMAEAVNIVNSRPLTRNSDSAADDEPLTPNHLLHMRHPHSLPPGVFSKEDQFCKRRWRQVQYISNLFWKRWSREYLPTLLERSKWNSPKRNFKVGDLVLIADDNYPRGQWPLGRIEEVFCGKDGFVRSVRLKTTSTVATYAKRQRRGEMKSTVISLVRPITKLCLLECD